MKKICICAFLILSASLYATGASYSMIGKYRDVEIRGINHRGIRISHSYGSCYLKEEDLSAADKRRLKEELRIYREKLAKYQERQKQKQSAQQDKLSVLSSKLPTMTQAEIEKWAKEEVGTEVFDSRFTEVFNEKFAQAGNCNSVLKEINKRLMVIQNNELDALYKQCEGKDNRAISTILSKKVGVPFSSKGFNQKFKDKYYAASNRNKFAKNIRTIISRNIEAEKEARRLAEERARREEEERNIRLANQYWRELLNEFAVTANQYRKYAFSNSRVADDFLHRLINHRNKANFIQQYVQLSYSQKDFLSQVSLAGLFGENHFKYLNLASRYTDIYQFNSSERCIQDAVDARRKAVTHFDQAVRAYNRM